MTGLPSAITAAYTPRRRSIPAPAGEPSSMGLSTHAFWVYPRACGGTTWKEGSADVVDGLSPRLRGNRPIVARRIAFFGSIPAPAGEPYEQAH